jgi:hypothetical protein
VAAKKKKRPMSLDERTDKVLAAVVGAVDYDHAKQLDEATAEEPDEVAVNRRSIRMVFVGAMREQGLSIGLSGDDRRTPRDPKGSR